MSKFLKSLTFTGIMLAAALFGNKSVSQPATTTLKVWPPSGIWDVVLNEISTDQHQCLIGAMNKAQEYGFALILENLTNVSTKPFFTAVLFDKDPAVQNSEIINLKVDKEDLGNYIVASKGVINGMYGDRIGLTDENVKEHITPAMADGQNLYVDNGTSTYTFPLEGYQREVKSFNECIDDVVAMNR